MTYSYFYSSVNPTSQQISTDYASGSINADGTPKFQFNSASQLLSGNVYQITFPIAHPQGEDYAITLGSQSDEPTQDQRKIQWLNKTANGFQVKLSVDDNGGNADPPVQSAFDYRVSYLTTVVTQVS